ncbi:cyclodeaminase/cyclohydrolase family protein [Pseudonocardia sp. MH-G8]|uniref:cyclodeaminase/cyclohydrolase family protein n=1 Tax=Pseudonocardia sp. MH-G8 TaxID=1854588 RepID=UPI000BA032AA|nr:cyclodeaminase/cyclohydrolase family protein [Pseudonocardia sp. MH-G8]OZM80969.1 formiminotransferase-cyclodeaminase [Pseudonocardia sp. MH-G8]
MADPDPSLLDLTVRELLDSVAARTPAPGGGGVAALATAMAAGLTAMAARFGDGAVAARADELRAAAAPLADADAAAYGAFLDATRRPRDEPGRAEAVSRARADTIAVPAVIADVAAEVAGLAADLVLNGNPNLRSDAAAAVHLAAGAAATAAELLASNARGEQGAAERDRARELAEAARVLAGQVDRE